MTCCLWQVHIRLLKKGHRKGNFFKSYSYVSFCLSVNDNFWSSFFVHPECCQKNIPVISLAKFWIKPNHRRSGPSNFSRKAYQNLFSYQLVITYCFSKKQNAHNSRKHKSRFCPCIMGTSTESERVENLCESQTSSLISHSSLLLLLHKPSCVPVRTHRLAT